MAISLKQRNKQRQEIRSVHNAHINYESWVEVNRQAILRNANMLVRTARPTFGMLVVIKANAYGLGSLEISKILDNDDIWGYGVATVSEGVELRNGGVKRGILVFRPALSETLDLYKEYKLTPVIDSIDVLEKCAIPFHLEIDTGMSRSGVRWDDDRSLKIFAGKEPEGVFTHFHSADTSKESIENQIRRFRAALTQLPARPKFLYCANSAAAVYGVPFTDLLRPGIFCYGGFIGNGDLKPDPVLSIRAKVISLRTINPGDTVSYDGSWRASRKTRIGTLAIGYADGLPRVLTKDAYVIINQSQCPIVGRVTMDMTMVDVSDCNQQVGLGDVATILGQDKFGNRIPFDEFAKWTHSIPYELMVRLGNRLPRLYV